VLKVPLTDALTVATLTPARLLGVDDRIGRLKPGFRANLVHLTNDLQVVEMWTGGRPAERDRRGRVSDWRGWASREG
jgi:N-acetylglucosamine-6-phosphate deacetylase